MPLTKKRLYRYPNSKAAPDLAAHVAALAEDVDADVENITADAARRSILQDARSVASEARVAALESAVLIYGNGYLPAAGPHVPDDDTEALYHLDQSLNDSSGNGYTLGQYETFRGSYSRLARFGTHSLNGGMYFNADADSVLSSTGKPGGTLLNGTVECWVKAAGPASGARVAICHRSWYWLGMVNGVAHAKYGPSSTLEQSLIGSTSLVGSDIDSAPWHHLALVFERGVARLFVNGSLEATNNTSATAGTHVLGGLYTGGIPLLPTYDWSTADNPGLVDEIRVSAVPRYTAAEGYPPRPALQAGAVTFVGPAIPAERKPFDQWIRTETK